MSNDREEIERLEQEARAAQELLFLVLDQIGEPVVLSIESVKEKMKGNRRIDLDLNEEEGVWVLKVVDLE